MKICKVMRKGNREEVAKIIYRFYPNGPKAVSGNVSPVHWYTVVPGGGK